MFLKIPVFHKPLMFYLIYLCRRTLRAKRIDEWKPLLKTKDDLSYIYKPCTNCVEIVRWAFFS